jgi:hypothetical protein
MQRKHLQDEFEAQKKSKSTDRLYNDDIEND